VKSTLDSALQAEVERVLERARPLLREGGVDGVAAVAMRVRDGAVCAMAGSPDYRDARHAGAVNAALSRRGAGSTLKPFLYACAFDRGWLTPATVLPDAPASYGTLLPENFDRTCSGAADAADALVRSLNLPALAVAREVGVADLSASLRAAGFATLTRPPAFYGLGLALGGADVRLIDLVAAYGCLARGGRPLRPHCLAGGTAAAPAPPVFSAEACWLVGEILSGPERYAGDVLPAGGVAAPRLAWKTGTSAGFRDAWTVAWNADWVVGVWMGNVSGAPSQSLTGLRVAPLAREILRAAGRGAPPGWYAEPAGVARREVCAVTGLLPSRRCGVRRPDWYIPGVTIGRGCEVAHGNGPAAVGVAQAADGRGPAGTGRAGGSPPAIRSPLDGSVFRAPPRPDGYPAASVPLARAGANGRAFWFVDGRFAGAAEGTEPLFWPMTPGRHVVACADDRGRVARASFEVEAETRRRGIPPGRTHLKPKSLGARNSVQPQIAE
jgi:penicillin-binding protein 1C